MSKSWAGPRPCCPPQADVLKRDRNQVAVWMYNDTESRRRSHDHQDRRTVSTPRADPALITGSSSSRVDESERRWSTRSSMVLIRGVPKNLRVSIRSRWRRCSRLSTMWPRIARSLSKSVTTKRPGSAPAVSSGPRRDEVADRRAHEQPGPRFTTPGSGAQSG